MNELLHIDALSGLKSLEDESVDCIITSPPYYQLRDYGSDLQIGLENSFQEYIDNLVQVFSEAKRVLKGSGTMFIVIGDTYSGSSIGMKNSNGGIDVNVRDYSFRTNLNELPRKSLMQIPSRLAITLQDDGWILRNEIIWHKPNAMPQSVNDRFTIDYEKIFFFVKQRFYYFNQIKEPMKSDDIGNVRGSKGVIGNLNSGLRDIKSIRTEPLRNKRSIWSIPTKGIAESHFATYPDELVEIMIEAGCPKDGVILDPFVGSGTTALVAKRKGYKYIGFDINQEYLKIANKRLKKTPVVIQLDL
ncbi:MAG: site-specific DNA-methyltransferase [Acholeplasma sp.]|nr:site-specific DNA-methyltransferase [Acholeplasma sp.]